MARPTKNEKKIQYTIMLEPSIIEEMKQIAERAGTPVGTFARNILLLGLDDARLLDKVGITRLIGSTRKQMEKIRKQFNLESIDFNAIDED